LARNSLKLKVNVPLELPSEDEPAGDIVHVTGASVFAWDDIYIGGEISYSYPSGKINKWDVKIQYDHDNYHMCFYSKTKKQIEMTKTKLGFGYCQTLNDQLKFATDFGFGFPIPFLRFGIKYKVDDLTKAKSNVFVEGRNSLRIGAALKQQINKQLSITLGSDLNVRKLLGEPVSLQDAHRFSMNLSYTD